MYRALDNEIELNMWFWYKIETLVCWNYKVPGNHHIFHNKYLEDLGR